jgi:hypothetical protein
MYPESSKTLHRGAGADLWRNTLAQIPTEFGRLLYLASLRNQNTGHYEHFGLAQSFGDEESDRTIRQSHEKTFLEWLSKGLEDQKLDLDEYLVSLGEEAQAVLLNWSRVSPWNIIPASAREVERDLFLSDFQMLLDLLRREHDVSFPDPDA